MHMRIERSARERTTVSSPAVTASWVGWLAGAGVALFWGTFWLRWGFYITGDATFLGPYIPTLEVIFPMCGVGIFLAFYAMYLGRSARTIPWGNLTFLTVLLAYLALNAVHSLQPMTSLAYLLVWGAGMLILACGGSFLRAQILFPALCMGLLVGTLVDILPQNMISNDLLGLGAIWGIILAGRTPMKLRWVVMLFLSWVLFETHDVWLILFGFGTMLTSPFWLPRRSTALFEVIAAGIFLFLLCGLGVWQGVFEPIMPTPTIVNWWSDWSRIFLGVGQGQYLIALQNAASEMLTTFRVPASAYGLILAEWGLVGMGFYLALLLYPIFGSRYARGWVSVFVIIASLCSSDIVLLPNGILFLVVVLLSESETDALRFAKTPQRSPRSHHSRFAGR